MSTFSYVVEREQFATRTKEEYGEGHLEGLGILFLLFVNNVLLLLLLENVPVLLLLQVAEVQAEDANPVHKQNWKYQYLNCCPCLAVLKQAHHVQAFSRQDRQDQS